MKNAVICDLDGTLCYNAERSDWFKKQFDAGRSFEQMDADEWLHLFCKTIPDDSANTAVKKIIKMFAAQETQILFVTARSTKLFEPTAAWLKQHFDGDNYTLWMREADDFRPDETIKRDLYEQYLAGQYSVILVLEDRSLCVAMWRNLGLECWQVSGEAAKPRKHKNYAKIRCRSPLLRRSRRT